MIGILLFFPDVNAGRNHSHADDDVRAVIKKMNRSISERNLEGLLSTFAPGSVRIDLFRAHNYGNIAETDDKNIKSSALIERWRSVSPMLFNTTRAYERIASHIDVHVDGGMAVAWVKIKTKTVPLQEGRKTKKNKFVEVVLLKLFEGEWKIAMVTNNRHDPVPS